MSYTKLIPNTFFLNLLFEKICSFEISMVIFGINKCISIGRHSF